MDQIRHHPFFYGVNWNAIRQIEAPFIPPTIDAFAEVLKEKGQEVERIVFAGHNHISVNLALATGEGDTWGDEVVAWIKAKI